MGKAINKEEIVTGLMRSVAEKFRQDFILIPDGAALPESLIARIRNHADAYLAAEMTDGYVVELLQKISGDSTCPVALIVSVPTSTFKPGPLSTGTIGIQLN